MVSVWRSPCDPVAQQYDAETHVIALRPLLVTVVGVVATDHATPLYCSMRAWSVPVELELTGREAAARRDARDPRQDAGLGGA